MIPRALFVTLLACFVAPHPTLLAQTVWDAGGAGNSSINLNTNWNSDTLPANDGTAAVQFGTGGSLATFNVDYFFNNVTLNRVSSFTLNSTGGNLILRSSNSGSTYTLTMSAGANSTQTINAPLRIDTNNADANKLFVIRNNQGNATNVLDINGDLARSTASSTDFQIRYEGVANSVTRFDGAISNASELRQASGVWAGTLIFGGSRTMGTTNINIATTAAGVGTPSSAAALVLGESPADVQAWGNLTLNNAMKVRIGGNVSVGTVAIGGNATAAETRVVGYSASTSSLSISAGTVSANATIGGGGLHENNLALVKTSTGTLSLNGTNTYAGGTTIENGGGSGSFAIALGANNALGTGPLLVGNENTGANGARLRMNGFQQTVSALSSGNTANARVIENFGSANSVLTVAQAADTTYAGVLRDRSTGAAGATGTLGLTKSGAGILTLSASGSTYTGVTTLSEGTLSVSSLGSAGVARTISTTAGSAVVAVDDTTGLTVGMTFAAATLPAGASIVSIDSPTQITLNTSANIATGAGVAAVFGVNSSIGMATAAASNLVFGGGTLRYVGGNASTNRNFTITGTNTARVDVENAATTLTLSGAAASGTGNFEKSGAGTLVMSGSNSFSGLTTVSAGTLLVGTTGSLGTGGVTVASGATFGGGGVLSGNLSMLSGSFFRFSLTETLTVNGAEVTFGNFGVANLVGLNNLVAPGTYALISGSATINTSNLANLGAGNAYDLGDGKSAYFQLGSLDLVVVPEPHPAALIGVSALLFAGLRRMRRLRHR